MATMIRWNPVREMLAMQNAIDRAFDETWRTVRPVAQSLPVDAYERDDAYVLVASLPGVGAENIQINYHDDVITISAQLAQHAPEGEKVRTHLNERPVGAVSRSLRLARPVNADAIEAVYVDGVLTLTLPKTAEAQPKTIAVRTTVSAN